MLLRPHWHHFLITFTRNNMERQLKHQILMVWWGEAFENTDQYLQFLEEYPYDIRWESKSWKGWLLNGLSDDFEWIRVKMPDTMNSYYPAWKIWFEKYFHFLSNQKLIIVGHSLWGIFLTKYLSENIFPRKIDVLHLVSPVFDNSGLTWESTASFTFNPANLKNIIPQTWKIHFWHSDDDTIVPFRHSEKYLHILPDSIFHRFENRWHFSNQSHFVELFLEIQKEV